MSNRSLLIDLDKCVRCHVCEIACRQENDVHYETGSRWCRVMTLEPRWLEKELHMDFVPTMCLQCDDPVCVHFCSVNALSRTAEGVVVVDNETCTGCKLCRYGCPYGAMGFNEDKKVAEKCDLCLDRTRHGLEPSCVQHCIGGALQWVTQEELKSVAAKEHTTATGSVVYSSGKWKLGNVIS